MSALRVRLRYWGFGRGVTGLVLAGVITGCQASESMSSMEATDVLSDVVDARTLFDGTWKLVRVERYDQRGELLPDFVHQEIGQPGALGYLMYDGERMAAVVQQAGRAESVSDVLTPEEALAAVESYTAYFGAYSIDTEDGYVVNQVLGSLNPRGAGGDTQPFYEFVENELVLTPSLQCPDSFLTDRGCGYGTTGIQLRNVWEKVAPSPASGIDSRFLGFWEIDRVERRTSGGREVPTPQYAVRPHDGSAYASGPCVLRRSSTDGDRSSCCDAGLCQLRWFVHGGWQRGGGRTPTGWASQSKQGR